MTLQTHVDIAASPERVWQVLTDFARHPEWNPLIRHISGNPRVGERLHVELGPPGKKPMAFRPVVLEAEPNRAFVWRGALGAGWIFAGEHFFRLEPHEDGTRFHHGEVFSGVLVPLLGKSLDTDTRAGFEAMNRALKGEAERES